MNKKRTPWYTLARQLMRDRKLRYWQLAEHMNVTAGCVGHWMVGRNRVTTEEITKIADFLEVPVTTLIADDPYWITDDEERKLMDAYRDMTPDERSLLLKMIKRE